MEMKKNVKWFDRKFQFNLPDDKYDSILQRLRNTPARIKEIVNGLSNDVLTQRINNKWSIQENIGHLIILEELHSARIDDFINGSEVLGAADLQNKQTYETDFNKRDLQDILAELEFVRKNFVERLENLDKEIKNRISIHPRLNQEMKPIDMAFFVAEHDDHHINIIQLSLSNLTGN